MKYRFSSLDVKVIAHELSSTLCGLRVANCYDLSSRIFLIKLHKPGQREQLVIDSGFRCHLTSYARTTAAEPSAFVAKLRKYLQTRRVTSVEQIGTDRVIEFSFSDGMYRLFLEFSAAGNIILCDRDLKVLTLLRRVPAGAGEEELREGMTYLLEKRLNFHGIPPLTLERLRTSMQAQIERSTKETTTGKFKKKQGNGLRRILTAATPEFSPVLLDHAFRVRHFDSSIPPEDVLKDEDKLQRLLDVLEEAKQQSEEVVASNPSKGYIIAKPAKQRPSDAPKNVEGGSDADKENVALVYEDFHPFRPRQFEDDPSSTVIEMIGFNKTVDDFFSSIESQKLESRLTEREIRAERKIEAAKADLEKRIGGLQQVQELNVRKAQALEANLQRVEEATAAVNGLIGQGMDWKDIASLIQTEKTRQNPVAAIIKLPLKLHENTITLLLGEEEQAEDELGFDDESQSEASEDEESKEDKENSENFKVGKGEKLLSVDVDLALTAWANAGQYYDQKRTAADKEEKTAQASGEALKSHEKKVQADLKKGLAQEKQVLRTVRQQLWFEKFFYFVSSEGYLVLGAKDKTQSDMLYKRHLGKGDVWIHANLEGASHVVVKNRPGLQDSPIPPSTLAQAGNFCVCSSEAWDNKAVMGAWWVGVNQVSKIAPSGDFLEPGYFEIKGQKNHLPPATLLLGFGAMFKLSDASMAKRGKSRIPLGEIPSLNEDGEKPSEKDDGEHHTSIKDEENVQSDEASEPESEGRNDDHKPALYQNPLQSQGLSTEVSDVGNDEEEKEEEEEEEGEEEVTEEAQKENSIENELADVKLDDNGSAKDDDDDGEDNASVAAESVATSTAASKTAPQVRGKHGKKAKMKAKYAWQDEEDRALALRLLGSTKGQEKKADEAEQRAVRDAADAAAKERRREQHRIAQQRGKEEEEARRRRLAGEEDGGNDDAADLSIVEKLVGMPKPGEEIEDCFIVCAPWDSMGPRFRWRTKIQPGTQKKGKAVKEILGSWLRDVGTRDKKRLPPEDSDMLAEEKLLRSEGDLLKSIRDVEVVGCLPIRSGRVVLGGGESGKGGGKGGGGGGGRGGKGGGKGGRGGKGNKKK